MVVSLIVIAIDRFTRTSICSSRISTCKNIIISGVSRSTSTNANTSISVDISTKYDY